jgi:hypothetical protein
MSLHFKGNTNLTVENIERTYSEANGWESVYVYKGLWSIIEAAKTNNAYVANASRVEVKQEPGGYGTLTVTFSSIDNEIIDTPTNEPETDVWTFSPFEVQRNIWESPYYSVLKFVEDPGHIQKIITSVESYNAKTKTQMDAGTRVGDPYDVTEFMYGTNGDTNPDLPFVYSPEIQTKSTQLANRLAEGTDTYATDKYALRNTRIVPGNTLLSANTFRTGWQWSNNRLVDFILSQKTEVTKFSICGELLVDFAGTYWLKKAPTMAELTNGKIEISSEFVNMQALELPTELFPVYL